MNDRPYRGIGEWWAEQRRAREAAAEAPDEEATDTETTKEG